ncbi:MAG: saccharopine dehydrogenase NADP-binding domain-containing protein [Patescibacteria group bacterium]|nr:saccharopine dehydrogenase NADP-binding domain-containing protein [Patescibacteria group bacterium]
MEKKKFDKKILMIGFGSVARCTLPILLDKLDVPLKNVTVMDFEDKTLALKKYLDNGLNFAMERVTKEDLGQTLAKYVDDGGLLIDLAWNIGANDILGWCHDHNVLYMNTSVEVWDSLGSVFKDSPYEKSLYWRQMKLRELTKNWHDAPTAVVDHGANPGMISHFVKQGLVDIAVSLIREKRVSQAKEEELYDYIKKRNFAKLAKELGVKVIHCSERDTQITNRPKEVDEFVGTWSIEGLREEGTAPAEMGWGTHEKELPALAHQPPVGPKNQIFLAQMGMNTWVRSWIPDQEIVGMIIRHGEAFGLSDRLTVWDGDKAVYRPTVHYAYMPCHETLSSLCELRGLNYVLPPKLRIMGDEIVTGADILGALIMGHDYKSWWTGSSLTIDQARQLAPGQNATTLQVAAGIVSAVLWMLENPRKGLNLPDDLPHDFILNIAKPYLGDFISRRSDWTPLKNRTIYFKENPASKCDKKDLWQFKNFLFVD